MAVTRPDGHRIIVTGGASGMGEGLVRALPTLGTLVVSLDITEEVGERIAKEAGATFVKVDVSGKVSGRRGLRGCGGGHRRVRRPYPQPLEGRRPGPPPGALLDRIQDRREPRLGGPTTATRWTGLLAIDKRVLSRTIVGLRELGLVGRLAELA